MTLAEKQLTSRQIRPLVVALMSKDPGMSYDGIRDELARRGFRSPVNSTLSKWRSVAGIPKAKQSSRKYDKERAQVITWRKKHPEWFTADYITALEKAGMGTPRPFIISGWLKKAGLPIPASSAQVYYRKSGMIDDVREMISSGMSADKTLSALIEKGYKHIPTRQSIITWGKPKLRKVKKFSPWRRIHNLITSESLPVSLILEEIWEIMEEADIDIRAQCDALIAHMTGSSLKDGAQYWLDKRHLKAAQDDDDEQAWRVAA